MLVLCRVKTLSDGLRAWLGASAWGVKPSTLKFYSEAVSTIEKTFANSGQLVSQITPEQVAAWAQIVAHYSPSRWNCLVQIMRAVCPAARSLRRRPLRFKDRPLISQLEFNRLLAECDRLPRSRAGLVVRFLAHTGLRITEARKLRWADVGANGITVPGSITKNSRPRFVPFVNGISETLDRLRALGGGTSTVLPPESIRRGLVKACGRAGLPVLSHHYFRHLFATRCIESGVDVPTVARWLGHSDGGALLSRTYYHLADAHSLAMAGRVKL